MYVSPQGLLVAGDDPQLDPNDKGLLAAVLPHAVGARVVARGFYEPWAFATGQNILTTAAAGLPSPGVGTNAASTQTVRLYPTASGTSTVWEKPVKAVSVLLVFVKYGASGGTTPMFGNTAPNTAPYEAWALDDASGNLTFSYSAGGTYRSVTGGGGSIQVGRVNVALGTYDGATARLFLNGVLLSSASQTGDLVYPTAADRGPGLGNFWNFTSSSRSLVGRIFLGALWETGLPAERAIGITKSPQAAFEAVLGSRRIWAPMPASAGGGSDIDIAGLAGNATAAGITGAPAVSIDIAGAVGNATAAGITGSAQVAVEIAGSVGNAVAAGVAGSASVTNDINIDGVVGNAVAAGVAGDTSVGSDISISGTVGNAVAAGTAGVPGVSTTIAAAVGNATAAGVSGLAAIGVLIDGAVGNATAAGISGTLTLDIVVAGVVANAVAAGVTGSASVDAAAVSAAPGYTIAAKDRRLTITAAARRLEIRK